MLHFAANFFIFLTLLQEYTGFQRKIVAQTVFGRFLKIDTLQFGYSKENLYLCPQIYNIQHGMA